MKLAHAAALRWAKTHPNPSEAYQFTPEQQVFLGFAQSLCGLWRPELTRQMTVTNPHPAPEWRVRGPVSNLESFRAAFHCQPGTPMARTGTEQCSVW
jgi:endothelin-converting enzyme/putative endopeptidase